MVLQWILLAVGFAMLIKGADFFVDGAVGIATRFGIPQLVIGLTIVAMGTSAPEAAVSISAAAKGNADITIGNILGSNILNILIILGITSVITVLTVSVSTVKFEIPFLLIVTAVLFLLGLDGKIGFLDGLVFIALLVGYIIYLLRLARTGGGSQEEENKKELKLPIALIMTGAGVALIIFGSQITVNAATEIAKAFGVSDRFIGLTVVAFGTSLPELVTSIKEEKKGNADIAVGNVVGSNIFNIIFVVGISALITTVPFTVSFRWDLMVSFVAAAALLAFCFKTKKLYKWAGIIFLAGYAAYFIFVLL